MANQEERTRLKRCHEDAIAETEGIKRHRRAEGTTPPMPPAVFKCVLAFLPWGALSALRRVNR